MGTRVEWEKFAEALFRQTTSPLFHLSPFSPSLSLRPSAKKEPPGIGRLLTRSPPHFSSINHSCVDQNRCA